MVKSVRWLVLLALAIGMLGVHATGALGSRAISGVSGTLTIAEEAQFRVAAPEATVICRVTFVIELGRRAQVEKVPASEIGTLTEARATNCRSNLGAGNNSVTFLVGAGWAVQYSSFSGTLPAITGVQLRIRAFAFLARWDSLIAGTLGCLWSGTPEMLINVEAGSARRIRWVEGGSRLRLFRQLEGAGGFTCFETFIFGGSMPLSPTLRLALVN